MEIQICFFARKEIDLFSFIFPWLIAVPCYRFLLQNKEKMEVFKEYNDCDRMIECSENSRQIMDHENKD